MSSSAHTTILHHDDLDGFTAAYIAREALGGEEKVNTRAIQHGDDLPTIPSGHNVYLLDFTFERQLLLQLASSVADEMVVIDHHESALLPLCQLLGMETVPASANHLSARVSECVEVLWKREGRCAAALTYEHFHPGKDLSTLVKYVQGHDLWTFEKLAHGAQVCAWLRAQERTFERFKEVDIQLESSRLGEGATEGAAWRKREESIVQQGDAILDHVDGQVASVLKEKRQRLDARQFPNNQLRGTTQPLIPYVVSRHYRNELADRMLEEHPGAPYVLVLRPKSDGRWIWRLTSHASGPHASIDVGRIAREFPGGGGHKNAAAFTLREEDHRECLARGHSGDAPRIQE